MKLFARLFMDPHQKALRQPEDYRAVLDPEKIKAEVKAKVTDSESRDLMLAELSNYGAPSASSSGQKRALTIGAVVDSSYSLRETTKGTLDGAMHQYGVEATLGAEFVVGFLTRRANAIADGIGSGATQALGDAL